MLMTTLRCNYGNRAPPRDAPSGSQDPRPHLTSSLPPSFPFCYLLYSSPASCSCSLYMLFFPHSPTYSSSSLPPLPSLLPLPPPHPALLPYVPFPITLRLFSLFPSFLSSATAISSTSFSCSSFFSLSSSSLLLLDPFKRIGFCMAEGFKGGFHGPIFMWNQVQRIRKGFKELFLRFLSVAGLHVCVFMYAYMYECV